MFNLDNITEKDNNKDCPYRKLIIGPSGSGKTKYLLNSIQKDSNIIDKTYLYAKDLEEPKYQLLINNIEKARINFNNDPTAFIEYSNSMDDIFPQIEDYSKKKKRKILIVFDDMISHVMSDKKAQQILKDLFIRCRKLNISLCFLTQSYFSVTKDVRLNCTHYILFKLNNKRELQNIAINHSADIDYKDFIKIYRNCTKELYNVLTIDTTNALYRKNTNISALSLGKLDNYEYLTGEDLGYRPDPVQKSKFEYSPIGQVLNKGLDSSEIQEGLLKRLKNIENKTC